MKSCSLGIKIISIFAVSMIIIISATAFFYYRNASIHKTQIDIVAHEGYKRVFQSVIDHQNRILDKALTNLLNVDELILFLVNQNDSASKMVLDGLFLSLKEKKINRFSLYDKDFKLVLQNNEESLPPRSKKLPVKFHEGYHKCAKDFTYYFYFRKNSDPKTVSTVDYCGVTSVTDDDDNLVGFAEISLDPGVWISEFSSITQCYIGAVDNTKKQVTFSTDKNLYKEIGTHLPKVFNAGITFNNKVDKKFFQSDPMPLAEPDKNIVSYLLLTRDYTSQQKTQNKNQLMITAFFVLFMVISITGVYLFVKKSITKPVNNAIEGLTLSTDRVRDYTAALASSSQSLADKASSQAASTEEISASLEETTSMTEQNAENADKTSKLMTDANTVAARADKFMSELIKSIGSVSEVSDETGNIIKKIEDIAFQTNLLALNAAVEAARAGEAGAGFAVVADEVRNLSMGAAKAASETAELLERSALEVKNCKDNSDRTNEVLKEVVGAAEKSRALISEIASASKEQKTGIEQINKAVTEIDKITQQNAATSEESAGAVKDLEAQTNEMKNHVSSLTKIIKGSG